MPSALCRVKSHVKGALPRTTTPELDRPCLRKRCPMHRARSRPASAAIFRMVPHSTLHAQHTRRKWQPHPSTPHTGPPSTLRPAASSSTVAALVAAALSWGDQRRRGPGDESQVATIAVTVTPTPQGRPRYPYKASSYVPGVRSEQDRSAAWAILYFILRLNGHLLRGRNAWNAYMQR